MSGLLLPDVENVGQIGGAAHLGQFLFLAGLDQAGLQLGIVVEVIIHGRFGTVGHDEDIFDPGSHGFLDDVLNDRLVHHGEHLFGHGLGGGQHTGAQSGGGNDCFAYFHGKNLLTDGVFSLSQSFFIV